MKKYSSTSRIITTSMLILVTQLFFSCGEQKNKIREESTTRQAVENLKKPASSFADTLIITSASALFYNPDSVQLIKIRDINKKPVYESLTHECFYQMRNARMVLKKYWPNIQVIESSKARYLLFMKDDGGKTIIDLNTKNDICGIFLFDRHKDPVLIDMMNIDTELGYYFKKQ